MVLNHVGRTVGVGDGLLDEHPAVVEVRVRRGGRYLLHTPVEVVVAVEAMPSPSNMAQASYHRHIIELHNPPKSFHRIKNAHALNASTTIKFKHNTHN